MSDAIFLPIVGGILIGLGSALPLIWHGRIAGVSGLIEDAYNSKSPSYSMSLMFLLGLIFAGLSQMGGSFQLNTGLDIDFSWKVALAGLLVGYGSRLGSGCTSGHGVCGLGRLNRRSIVATLVFLLAAILTANSLRAFL